MLANSNNVSVSKWKTAANNNIQTAKVKDRRVPNELHFDL